MNWIQENKKLAGILGVTIVGALGLGVYLFLSYGAYNARMEEYSTTGGKVKQLKSQKLFPSAANADEKEQLVHEYADQVNLLRNALLNPDVQQPVKPISETDFQGKLKERANLIKKAAESTGILLPSDFALGFDEYTNTVPRSPELAAELSLHLDVIERLIATLIESGVKSLDSLDRTKLPAERGATPPPVIAPPKPAPGAAAAAARNKNKNKKKPLITAAAAAEPVLDRYPIKIVLTADQGPFQSVINTLSDPAKMPHFLVVRQLRVENERADGPLKDEIRTKIQQAASSAGSSNSSSGDGFDPGAAKPDIANANPQAILPPPPAAPDTFTVMGEEMIKVYLEVDYVRFRKAAEPSESATAAAQP